MAARPRDYAWSNYQAHALGAEDLVARRRNGFVVPHASAPALALVDSLIDAFFAMFFLEINF